MRIVYLHLIGTRIEYDAWSTIRDNNRHDLADCHHCASGMDAHELLVGRVISAICMSFSATLSSVNVLSKNGLSHALGKLMNGLLRPRGFSDLFESRDATAPPSDVVLSYVLPRPPTAPSMHPFWSTRIRPGKVAPF